MDLEFPSKRDVWLAVVVWTGTAMLVAGAIVTLVSPGAITARLALVATMLGAGAFGPWVLYGTGYHVTAVEIAVRSGPFRWRVPLDAIESVVPSCNPLSSPADKSRFLAARCPALVLAGDRLLARLS